MDFTTIRVSEPVADELARRKGRGESYDDIIRQLLGMDEPDESPESAESADRYDPGEDGEVTASVDHAVQEVAAGWDVDDRFSNRKAAAQMVLRHAVETGEAIGKSSEIVEEARETYPVEGQSDETYWRQNIRAVLSEFGAYSKAKQGYTVAPEDLELRD
jgi:hypothetical protein